VGLVNDFVFLRREEHSYHNEQNAGCRKRNVYRQIEPYVEKVENLAYGVEQRLCYGVYKIGKSAALPRKPGKHRAHQKQKQGYVAEGGNERGSNMKKRNHNLQPVLICMIFWINLLIEPKSRQIKTQRDDFRPVESSLKCCF
jgi:hypothetical protein